MLRFFNGLSSDQERWDYIEDYFLGWDVLCNAQAETTNVVSMSKCIDKEKSYPTHQFKKWSDLEYFFDENDHVVIGKMATQGLPIPEYLETTIKKSDMGEDIVMSWPSKDILICQQDTADTTMKEFVKLGWHAYRIYDIDFDEIKGVFK